MRWTKHKDGEKRIIRKFLIFPKTISGETRWLETTSYVQMYRVGTSHSWWETMCWKMEEE